MQWIVDAIAKADIWQLAIAVIAVVAGSSAVSALITSLFQRNQASKSFRREVRKEALQAIGAAYGCYMHYGNLPAADFKAATDRHRIVAERTAVMRAAVAAVGESKLNPLCNRLATQGELFASQDPETEIPVVTATFTELIELISKQVPRK